MINKTSDKNVGSIEDLKEYEINLSQKQSIELLKDTLNKFEIRGEQLCLLKIAIKNILAEREQKDKRIQELEEEKAMLKRASNIAKEVNIEDVTDVINKSCKEFMSNYIPKQAVIDKIKELDIAILECEYDDDDVEEYKNDVEKEKRILLIKKSALEELLEEK